MLTLVNSLRHNWESEPCSFRVYNDSESAESNICTKSQVAKALDKGWVTYYYNSTDGWKKYEGSEDVTIAIDAENFPDENFRAYLSEQNYGKDGVITGNEIEKITSINVSLRNINSLAGIEYFTELTELYCHGNQLTNLDVSNSLALVILSCYSNQLTNLDVSNNAALTTLRCYNNRLKDLELSNNAALTTLECQRNLLTSLDVSNCTSLTFLECYRNQIKGEAMDALINGLRQNTDSEDKPYSFYVYNNSDSSEGNICTKSQATTANKKGWSAYYWDNTIQNWKEYEYDEEPNGLNTVYADEQGKVVIYTINGTKLHTTTISNLPSGIYIVNGKNVMVK